MQNRLRRVLFVALLRVVIRTANYCCYMSLRCNRLRLLAGLSFSAEQAKASMSMLLDARKKQPTTSLASPSRAHRRVLAEPTGPAPKPEAAMPTPTLTAAVGPSGHAGMVVRLARAA